MKLHFDIFDGVLEAREEGGYVYEIIQYEGDEDCYAFLGHRELFKGDLYGCLDACNEHYSSNKH